ncbi:phosphoribosyltransferase family protein [Sediminitomix flava]|uniref:Pyrimidine operon attenuation protein/uracil phosphoribosyltransferase n=1 Tax=Sediminitomix flava TaxID=379075 RepID=A0A315Z0T5_SEDFL|nr:phosphoribosyltransferase family protein [Sediminitomix flava]PWJ36034.1 pyrimidine operon attenuation protein/uracil phosphoribosyltransferase [Sediminitomix flava]
MTESNIILSHEQVMRKIRRIAFEIYEQNFEEKEVIFAGIVGGGYELAKLLQKEFSAISPLNNSLLKVTLDKKAITQTFIELDQPLEELNDKVIIIVDDVLNTGKTLVHSLKPFLNISVNKLQIAVLVDRNHRSFPVSADYTGYELSTTIQEHIEVILEDTNDISVTLF